MKRSPQEQRKLKVEVLVVNALHFARPCPLSKKFLYSLVEAEIESPDELQDALASLERSEWIETDRWSLWAGPKNPVTPLPSKAKQKQQEGPTP